MGRRSITCSRGFVKAAPVELPRGVRINCISPTVLAESPQYHPYFPGYIPVPAAEVALAYSRAMSTPITGRILKLHKTNCSALYPTQWERPLNSKWRSSVRLCAARGLPDCLQFGIQFPRDLRDPLIAELSKKRRRKVVLKDRLPRLVFVKHKAQGCIEPGR